MKRIIILGVSPPPIGGVTIHIKRLLEYLNIKNANYEFFDIRRTSILFILYKILSNKVVHLHTSNAYFRFIVVVLSLLFNKRTIFTYHANLGASSKLKTVLDFWSIRMAYMPIMLNEGSLEKAQKVNKNAILLPAFIPPIHEPSLSELTIERIHSFRDRYKILWATNAFKMRYDKNNKETYQMSLLVNVFSCLDDCGLIISDPSGTYTSFFREKNIILPSNVIILTGLHSFYEVLKQVDGLLRITTTDGDSLSVKEGLYLGKPVIASNVVKRPEGVILTNIDRDEVLNAIISVNVKNVKTKGTVDIENAAEKLMEIYSLL